MVRCLSLVFSLLVAVPAAAFAQSDSLADNLGPRELGIGESLRAAAHGRTATVLNPAGLALQRTYVVEATAGTRGADDATVAGASICDSVTSQVGACLYYAYLTASPEESERSFHQVGLTTALPVGSLLALGITQRYSVYDESGALAIPEDDSGSSYHLDAGLTLLLGGGFNLAAVGYNLIGSDDVLHPFGFGTGLAFSPSEMLLVAADAHWNFETDEARYGGGAELFLASDGGQTGFALRAGYVYDTIGAQYVTGGAGYVTPRVALDAAIRRQVDGGSEIALEFGLRLFLPN